MSDVLITYIVCLFEWRIYALSASKAIFGQEHTVITIQSGDHDYLMNETKKPTTGTRCPTLFDKWHGTF